MLATPGRNIPAGEGWVMQPKFDGYRALIVKDRGRARLQSRNGRPLDVTRLEEHLLGLADGTVLDSELVALVAGPAGTVQARGQIPAALAGRFTGTLALVCFDVLYDEGRDLRALPWINRHSRLADLVAGDGPLILIDCFPPAAGTHEALVSAGFEGTVCKRTSSLYRSGRRSRSWVKLRGRLRAD